jgi:hypothetical protein
VPEWHPYDVPDADGPTIPIIAKEFLENDGTVATNMEEVWAALRDVGAEGRHEDNFRVSDVRAIVIDAGGVSEDFHGLSTSHTSHSLQNSTWNPCGHSLK